MNRAEPDPYRPTGRKHYKTCDEHKSWNFLHHQPSTNTHIVQFEDHPSLQRCRFGKGFQRKSLDQIWPNKEEKRVREWNNAIQRRKEHERTRREFISSKTNINGNIVTSQIPAANERALFQTKRKITFNDEVSKREQTIRSKISKNRFYDPALSKRPQIKKIIPNQKHFSSDIRIGKNDIKSKGTLDAFQGHGYE